MTKTINIYAGRTSCNVTFPRQDGVLITQTITVDVSDITTNIIYIVLDVFGVSYTSNSNLIPLNSSSCVATVPLDRVVPSEYNFWYEPIAPYPGAVDGERLGCVNANQRKINLSVYNINGATKMKVYAQSAPNYPEIVVYSGAAINNLLVTVDATFNTVYIRTKLDNGSSHYLSVPSVACTGGGGVPLN